LNINKAFPNTRNFPTTINPVYSPENPRFHPTTTKPPPKNQRRKTAKNKQETNWKHSSRKNRRLNRSSNEQKQQKTKAKIHTHIHETEKPKLAIRL